MSGAVPKLNLVFKESLAGECVRGSDDNGRKSRNYPGIQSGPAASNYRSLL